MLFVACCLLCVVLLFGSSCLLRVCCLSFVGCFVSYGRCASFVVCCVLIVGCGSLFVVCCSLFVVCFVVGYVLVDGRCVLLVVGWWWLCFGVYCALCVVC